MKATALIVWSPEQIASAARTLENLWKMGTAHTPDTWRAVAEAVLNAATGSDGVADGWVLVPREPTEAMLKAGDAAYWAKRQDTMSPTPTEHPEDGGGAQGYAYRAMLAAVRP